MYLKCLASGFRPNEKATALRMDHTLALLSSKFIFISYECTAAISTMISSWARTRLHLLGVPEEGMRHVGEHAILLRPANIIISTEGLVGKYRAGYLQLTSGRCFVR